MKSILFTAIALLALVYPDDGRADFRRICRGASLYKYQTEIKKSVKFKLSRAGVGFSRVKVDFTGITRPSDTYVNDFESDLSIGSGDTPSVSFSGAFPNVSTCSISLNVKITVIYPNGGRSVSVIPTTVEGTLLPPLAVNSKVDE